MIAVAVDAILVLVVVEGIVLVALHRRTGRGPAPPRLIATLAAGFLLMLATRLALAQSAAILIAGCLLTALVAHVTDLALRWRD